MSHSGAERAACWEGPPLRHREVGKPEPGATVSGARRRQAATREGAGPRPSPLWTRVCRAARFQRLQSLCFEGCPGCSLCSSPSATTVH